MYVVLNYDKLGNIVGLRGTVFAMSFERATRFETEDAARAAMEKAAQFYPKRYYAKTFIDRADRYDAQGVPLA